MYNISKQQGTYHSGDVGSIVQGHNSLQVLRQVGTPSRLASGEGSVLDGVGVGDVVHKGQTVATESLPVRANATNADAYRMLCKD